MQRTALRAAADAGVTIWISPTYLKESEVVKTCDINISDSESQGGAICYASVNIKVLEIVG
jgi:hypothetical protein